MTRALAAAACLLAAVAAPAQQEPPPPPAPAPLGPEPAKPPPPPPRDEQASQRLHRAIATTAALPSCSFALQWGPDADPQQTVIGGPGSSGKAAGQWAGDEEHLAIGDDQLRLRAGVMIAKDANTAWVARTGHFADGNPTGFVPAPARLLRALAAMDITVTARAPSSIEDRPVEVATARLDPQQFTALVWDGLLPDMGTSGVAFGVLGGNGNRAAAPPIDAMVDLAVHFDPGTGNVFRVHLRSYHKNVGVGRFVVRGGGQIMIAGGAVRGQVMIGGGTDDDDAEDTEKATPKPTDEGLPARRRKNVVVDDFLLELSQHGAAQLPPLDEQGERLLAR